MTFIKCLSPKRPQSIVHKIGRLSSSIALPFSHKTEHKSNSEKSKKDNKKSVPKFYKNRESSSLVTLNSLTVKEFSSAYGSDDDFSVVSVDERSLGKSNKLNDEEDFFVDLDQNEFLMECFMTNECSDVTFLVHFHAEDSALSEHIEDIILIRTMEAGSNCQCRRVNSRLAPLFTAKLGIDPEQPTVVAIRNGSVIHRISDISSGCWELERWLVDTHILKQNPDRDAFPSINIHSC